MENQEWDVHPQGGYQDPYYEQPYRPVRKKRTGLVVVLVVLALLVGLVSWAAHVLDLQWQLWKNGLVVTVGEVADGLLPDQAPVQQTQIHAPTVPVPSQTEPVNQAVLELEDSRQSIDNRPSPATNALSLQEIYEKVAPSVASISCISESGSGTGTGIVMSRDGYVITNYHVIKNARQIYVLLATDRQYVARVIGGDETTDLAVLQIDAENLQAAEFGNSDALRVGDAVVAIGDPLGTELRGTMTDGIVSAINRDLNLSGRQMTLIQTNAALNSGNSGGPLINCYGQVIGINTMKMSSYSATSATVEGLGFAIPITAAKPIIDELITQGYVSGRPAIGINGQTLNLRTQFFYHLPSGVIITGIVEGSDAQNKGLHTDDIIVAMNGLDIASLEDLVAAKNDMTAGETVTLTIYRGGHYYEVDVTLMDQIHPEIY